MAHSPPQSPTPLMHISSRPKAPELPTDFSESPASENHSVDDQRFVDAIHELRKSNAKQFNSLRSTLERLSSAVEALNQQPQSYDKKTTFWTAYKSLADECDREFQRKYGNDLDTLLIFAGLFSAVSSAFIIQIQPELQPDPNSMTRALIAALVQNVTGAAVPTVQLTTQTGPATIVVVAQSLLFFSLASTLLAALLAVLGKQWLLQYDSVGDRGTIEERGLERQRKFDGLRRWRFDLVLQLFPLLLQFAVLMFAAALSIYLWTIHHVIAAIVLMMTCMGVILCTAMVISALAAPDSPFQTALTTLLGDTIKIIPLSGPLLSLSSGAGKLLYSARDTSYRFLFRTYSAVQTTIPPLLPHFAMLERPSLTPPPPIFDEIPQPSKEVPAVAWVLETSTDPRLVEAAAAVATDLQWPLNLELRPSLRRLSDIFNSCFAGGAVRDGMGDRANSCIKAFAVLEMVAERNDGWVDAWTFEHKQIYTTHPAELPSMLRVLRPSNWASFKRGIDRPPAIPPWTLRFIPLMRLPEPHLKTVVEYFKPDQSALTDPSIFADFLFCVNSFFAPPLTRDIALMDKGSYCVLLTTLVFENLAKRLTDDPPLPIVIAEEIVERILEFELDSHYTPDEDFRCIHAVYRFCAAPGLAPSIVMAILPLVRHRMPDPKLGVLQSDPMDTVAWAYTALEQLHDSQAEDADVIGDLLAVLIYYDHIRGKPTPAALRTVLWALSSESNNDRARSLAFRLLLSAEDWFQDNSLQAVLQDHSVWPTLGAHTMASSRSTAYYGMTAEYIALGDNLSQRPEWKAVIAQDLPGWLANLLWVLEAGRPKTRRAFLAVLSRVWGANVTERMYFMDGEVDLVMAFTALANVWDQLDFSSLSDIRRLDRLVNSTVWTVFRVFLWIQTSLENPTRRFKDAVISRFGDAVERAAENAAAAASQDDLDPVLKDRVTRGAEILSQLAVKIKSPLTNGLGEETEIGYWSEADVAAVRALIPMAS